MRDPYSVLGVKPDASDQEIKISLYFNFELFSITPSSKP